MLNQDSVQATLPAALLALVLALFTVPGDFVFDDIHTVVENERIASITSIPSLFAENYWGEFAQGGLYRPLTLTALAIQRAIFGVESATGYHMVNALLYAACSGLVGLIALRLGAKAPIASAIGLLFAAHPIHVEAYAPVVAISELGAGLCALLLLARQISPTATTRTAVISGVLFFAALCFKENALAVLVPLALVHLYHARSTSVHPTPIRHHARSYAALVVAGVTWFLLRTNALSQPVDEIGVLNNVLSERDSAGRIAGGLEITARYFKMAVAPWPLSADYSFPALNPAEKLGAGLAILGATLWVLTALTVLWLWRRGHAAVVGVAFFAAALFPVCNILFPIGTVFAERLLFLPTVGACLALAAALSSIRRFENRAIAAVLIVIAGVGALASLVRIPDWRSELDLTESIVKVQKLSAKGHEKFGWELLQDSRRSDFDGDREKQRTRAVRHLERSIALYPEHDNAYLNLGIAYGERGDLWKMHDTAQKYVARAPHDIEGHALLTLAQLRLDQPKNAALTASRAIESLSQDSQIHKLHRLRGQAYTRLGSYGPAAADLQIATAAQPDDVGALLLYLPALAQSGNQATAIRVIGEVLATPTSAPRYRALRGEFPALHNNRGLMLADRGDHERALADYTRALQYLPGFALARKNRVTALLRLGRRDEADADVALLREQLGAAEVDAWYAELLHGIPDGR